MGSRSRRETKRVATFNFFENAKTFIFRFPAERLEINWTRFPKRSPFESILKLKPDIELALMLFFMISKKSFDLNLCYAGFLNILIGCFESCDHFKPII